MSSRPSSQTRYSLRNGHVAPERYSYLPLRDDTIRLFRLHPSAEPHAPLQCTLFHTPLANAPPYVALSYAWGSQVSRHSLNIASTSSSSPSSSLSQDPSSSALTITVSLFNALQRLRQEDEEVTLWVDAICIDQSNTPERNVQTANMRRIYQNAQSVAVWLGLEYNESSDALALVREMIETQLTAPDELPELLQDEEDRLRALVRLFRRQYW